MVDSGWGEDWENVELPVAPARARLKRPTARKSRRRRRRNRRIALGTILGLVVAVAAVVGMLALDAQRAAVALQSAASSLPGLEAQLRENPAEASLTLTRVQEDAQLAANRTSGPLWRTAARIPGMIGANISALTEMADLVNHLSHQVLPQMSEVAYSVSPANLAPANGRINLNPVIDARDAVLGAHAAATYAMHRVSAIDHTYLIDQLSDAANLLEEQLVGVLGVTVTAARAVELIPPMFGADGPREWLVLAQNSAQQRALGGIPGSVIQLMADDGGIAFTGTLSTADVRRREEPILPVTGPELDLWGDPIARWLQNVTLTPDFPRAAALAAAMVNDEAGWNPQGVMSVDPVALEYLIAASGPVTFEAPDGREITLTGENTSRFLLSEVYYEFRNPLDQDEVFASAAEAAFKGIMNSGANPGRLLNAVIRLVEEGRIIVWSANPAEQALLAPTMLSGELRGKAVSVVGEAQPVVGAFLNLTSSSKIGFYLEQTVEIRDVEVAADGSQSFVAYVSLRNLLLPGEWDYLPPYVTGDTPDDGTITVNLLMYAPYGGSFGMVTKASGEPVALRMVQHDGLDMRLHPASVPAGQTVTLRYEITSGAGQPGEISVRTTPGPFSIS